MFSQTFFYIQFRPKYISLHSVLCHVVPTKKSTHLKFCLLELVQVLDWQTHGVLLIVCQRSRQYIWSFPPPWGKGLILRAHGICGIIVLINFVSEQCPDVFTDVSKCTMTDLNKRQSKHLFQTFIEYQLFRGLQSVFVYLAGY